MSSLKSCPHCGHSLSLEQVQHSDSSEITDIEVLEPDQEQQLVKTISKKVVGEVMNTIHPLLEKLRELAAGQQQVQTPINKMNNQYNTEEQLKKIQETARERAKAQEQKIAIRLRKLQSRVSKHLR